MFDLISTTEQTNTSSNIIKNQKANTKYQINLIKSPKTRININGGEMAIDNVLIRFYMSI